MTGRRLPASVFVALVISLGGVVIAGASFLVVAHWNQFHTSGPLTSPNSIFGIVTFVGLAAVSSRIGILIAHPGGEHSRQSLGSVGGLAVVVVFPPFMAVVMITLATVVDQVISSAVYGRRKLHRTLFNVASIGLSTAAAAIVFAGVGGRQLLVTPHLPQESGQILVSVVGAIAAGYAVAYGLLVGVVSLTTGRPLKSVFLESHRNTILPEFTAAVVGMLFGYLWLVDAPLCPLALLPLAVIYIAFRSIVQLQELDHLKSSFITEVSHELRTPLSTIVASSELLYHSGPDLTQAQARDLSRSTYESSNLLFRLVENMLNATTLQSGTLHVRPVSVSVEEMATDAAKQVEPFLEAKNQTLTVDLPADLPEVLADPSLIVQVLINLLTNASKYAEKQTTISILGAAEGSVVRISVKDNGIGIQPEDQLRIFDRYYRVPNVVMSSVVGSGLGLTIVKSIVDLHDGKVGVTSTAGAGSEFWFTLAQVPMAHIE